MLLQEKESGDLIEILDVDALISPTKQEVPGKKSSWSGRARDSNFSKK